MHTKEKNYLSAPLQTWLKQNPDGEKRLLDAGISQRSQRKITTGECTDKFYIHYKTAIETVTGLLVDEVFISVAKRILWEGDDKFPSITTRATLCEVLRKEAAGRHQLLKKLLAIDGPQRLMIITEDPNGLWLVRIVSMLTGLEILSSPQPPSKTPPARIEKPLPFEDSKNNNTSQRTADSVLSILNSCSNMLGVNVDCTKVMKQTKINAAHTVVKILERFGVTPELLNDFNKNRDSADTSNVGHLLKFFSKGK